MCNVCGDLYIVVKWKIDVLGAFLMAFCSINVVA